MGMDIAAAAAFSRLLTSSGYRTFHLAFGDGNHDFANWARFVGDLGDPLLGLVELFLLMRTVDEARVRRLLGDAVVDALLAETVLIAAEGGLRTPRLVLISFRSLLIFHEVVMRPGVYFGEDSIALGVYQTPTYGGTTLDLCSGTSIQAMIAAQHGARAYAVEINPRAAQIAAVNLRLNALHDRVTLVTASLEDYAAQTKERFDLITFNPPLLPVPPALDYPFVGDGGSDGLEVTARALELYLPHLAEGGGIDFIGCGLGTARNATFVDQLAEIIGRHNARGRVQLLARHELRRGEGFFESLCATVAMNDGLSMELAHTVYEMHFRNLGVDEVYTFFMRVERGGVARDGEPVAVTDLSEGGKLWFLTA